MIVEDSAWRKDKRDGSEQPTTPQQQAPSFIRSTEPTAERDWGGFRKRSPPPTQQSEPNETVGFRKRSPPPTQQNETKETGGFSLGFRNKNISEKP